jgi:hypothetical protein
MTTTMNTTRPGLLDGANCPPEQLRRAARYIASQSDNAEACAELLDMLGLTAADGLAREE